MVISYKKRPALLLKDSNDGDIIVCRITSQIHKTENDVKIEAWEKAGLKLPSIIRVHKIATLEKDMIESFMGKIDDKTQTKVQKLFSKLLD